MRSADLKLLTWLLPEMYSIQTYHYSRVVKSHEPAAGKIRHLLGIGRLLCLAFL